ncbi:MAG: DUF599 domain-containing protein [Rickettsiales bacterium]|nr:DUF599 domain-containing protein [Rickettsiales bacterium]
MMEEHWQEWLALTFFIVCWFGYAYYSGHEARTTPHLMGATNSLRLRWMREMLGRENRSLDAIMVGNLARSFTFFASTSMFILAALVSTLGYRDRVNDIIHEIPYTKLNDPFIWQIKIFTLIIIFIYAFFKHTWSMRQYNYVCMFIAAAPDYRERKDEHEAIAQKGALLTSNAARHFGNGLRAYYYGLATLAWFLHPYAFMTATALVVYVTYRREFRSATLKHLS